MFFEILLAILAGIIFGCIAGLIPGLHPNTITVGLLSISPFLLSFASPLLLAIFIISVATSNTFIDSIPSCYLGAPEESTALGVLPMHRLLLEGKGHEAISLTVLGGIGSIILGVILIPVLIPSFKFIFPYLKKSIIYLLIFSVLFLFYREKTSRFYAMLIFFLSGILGIMTLNFPNLTEPLFPLFSGLFGISSLVLSLNENTKIPKQVITSPEIDKKTIFKTIPASVFSGGLVSTLPALGPSQAAILGSSIIGKLSTRGFIVLIGGIDTVNFVLSFISLYLLDKARNGAVVAISKIMGEITINEFILFISIAMISAGIGAILTIYISKIFAKLIQKVNYQKLIISIISLIIFLVLLISGFYGFLILIVGTFIGIIPSLTNTGKNHLMGALMLPVILFYLL